MLLWKKAAFATKMLATPLYPPQPFREDHDATQYRPAKDIEAFNKLLPPPVEFVEGSSTGTLALGDGKYQPINAPPPTPVKQSKSEVSSPRCRTHAYDLNFPRPNLSNPLRTHLLLLALLGPHSLRNHYTPKTLSSLGHPMLLWALDCRIAETLAF